MICLGIESTAHTFSVGIVTDAGEILGLASDTFIPDQGGLTPQKVVEHHYACFDEILISALTEAKVTPKDLDVVAFSRGPGLGRPLAIGAAVGRSLSLKLGIPLIGVNHCVAHVEIGRKLCTSEDPITLYVSGGNTIISAFESNRYQIFGETLDLPIGNMMDKIARELGIPHPGGPKIELMAKRGIKFYQLPYIVKGMDLSYSGLFSATSLTLKEKTYKRDHYSVEDIIYSLQETAFAMLGEVLERALAHTEKHEVLLTGGVAANTRLQEMIRDIAQNHNAKFNVVPRKVSGDNGAMIAWAGIEQFKASGGETPNRTRLLPKWRMDEVPITWRKEVQKFSIPPNTFPVVENIPGFPSLKGQIFRKGAEAELIKANLMDRECLIKYRRPKTYRCKEIDREVRIRRTSREAKRLAQFAQLGIPVPPVYQTIPKEGIIVMKFIAGLRLKDKMSALQPSQKVTIFHNIGKYLSMIHEHGYTHGDLTTSNILVNAHLQIFFIDFGLSERSDKLEERAMDLHLFKQVLLSTHGNEFELLYSAFTEGYRKFQPKLKSKIIAHVDKIELRGRYIPKDRRRD